jgi:hypothetical protein
MYTKARKELEKDKKRSNEEKAWSYERLTDLVAPLLMAVSGKAGTGKSYLIKMLADALTLKYTDEKTRSTQPAVLLSAPTGLAAVQIGGVTCHSLVRLGVAHGRDAAFEPLSDMSRDVLRLQVTLLQ